MKRSFLRALLALLSVVAFLNISRAEDWPSYRGPHADGIVTESGLLTEWPASGPKLLWSTPLRDEGKSSHGGPSIAGQRVVLPFRSGTTDVIVCLNADDGKELWRYAYEIPVRVEAYGTGIRTNPTIYGKRVFTLGCFGQLHCLALETGKLVWEKDLVKDFNGRVPGFGESSSPVIMNGMLICEPGGVGNAVVALDPETGKTIWHAGNDEASYSTPQQITIDGAEQVLAFMDPGLIAYDLKDGHELWRFDYQEERQKNIPQPVAIGNVIYLTNNTLGFSAIKVTRAGDKWNVDRVWTMRKEKLHYSSPVKGDGCLYYQNSKRELHCMDLANGNVLWSAPNMGQQFATVLRLDEHNLLAALDDGDVALLDVSPKAFHEKARFKAVDKTFVQPSIANRKLFIRDHDHLACYDLSATPAAPQPVAASAVSAAPTVPDQPQKITPAAASLTKPAPGSGFFANWHYLRNDFLVTWLAALSLALIGVWAVSRREAVEGTVVGAAAALGSALAMFVSGLKNTHKDFIHSSRFYVIMPLLLAGIAALSVGFGRLNSGQARPSKRAWIVGAIVAVALFVLSRLTMSAVDISSILLSTEYTGTRSEVSNLMHTTEVTVALVLLMLSTLGTRAPKALRFVLYLWFAVMIGLCVQATGLLFTLPTLLLPALIAERIAANVWARAALASACALAATFAGWVIAQYHTCTFAYPATAILLTVFLLAFGIRLWRPREATELSGRMQPNT